MEGKGLALRPVGVVVTTQGYPMRCRIGAGVPVTQWSVWPSRLGPQENFEFALYCNQ
jgi:hypothetical protein